MFTYHCRPRGCTLRRVPRRERAFRSCFQSSSPFSCHNWRRARAAGTRHAPRRRTLKLVSQRLHRPSARSVAAVAMTRCVFCSEIVYDHGSVVSLLSLLYCIYNWARYNNYVLCPCVVCISASSHNDALLFLCFGKYSTSHDEN